MVETFYKVTIDTGVPVPSDPCQHLVFSCFTFNFSKRVCFNLGISSDDLIMWNNFSSHFGRLRGLNISFCEVPIQVLLLLFKNQDFIFHMTVLCHMKGEYLLPASNLVFHFVTVSFEQSLF